MTDFRGFLCLFAPFLTVGLGAATPGHAADRVGTALLVYTDSDEVTVWKPTTTGTVVVGPVNASARFSTDFITAASVDLLSAASPRGFSEVRLEGGGGLGWDFGEGRRVDAGYSVSTEPDFVSHSTSLTAATDLVDRRLTAILGTGLSWSEVGRTGDPNAWRSRSGTDFSAQGSVVLAPATVLDIVWTGQRISGYQASPYRFVRLFAPSSERAATAVAESVPDLRWRHAATLRLRHRLGRTVFGAADYRFYADTWGMRAHTATARASWTLGGDWTLTGEARGHLQDGVSFYRSRYDTPAAIAPGSQAPVFRTADKELGPMWTAMGGVHLAYELTVGKLPPVFLGIGADVLQMRYLDHPLLTDRTALLTLVDLSWQR